MLHQRGFLPPSEEELADIERDWRNLGTWYARSTVSDDLEERLKNNIQRRGRLLATREKRD